MLDKPPARTVWPPGTVRIPRPNGSASARNSNSGRGAVPKSWLVKPHRIPAPQVPRSKELQLLPPLPRQPGNSLPGGNESDGLRTFDAPALKRRTADGAEAPYSGASGTMRQRAASQQPTFWACTRAGTKRSCGSTGLRQRQYGQSWRWWFCRRWFAPTLLTQWTAEIQTSRPGRKMI